MKRLAIDVFSSSRVSSWPTILGAALLIPASALAQFAQYHFAKEMTYVLRTADPIGNYSYAGHAFAENDPLPPRGSDPGGQIARASSNGPKDVDYNEGVAGGRIAVQTKRFPDSPRDANLLWEGPPPGPVSKTANYRWPLDNGDFAGNTATPVSKIWDASVDAAFANAESYVKVTRKPDEGVAVARTEIYGNALVGPLPAGIEKAYAEAVSVSRVALLGRILKADIYDLINDTRRRLSLSVGQEGILALKRPVGGTDDDNWVAAKRRDPVFFTFLDDEGSILAEELLFAQSWDLLGSGEIQWDDTGLRMALEPDASASITTESPSSWVVGDLTGEISFSAGSLTTSGIFDRSDWNVGVRDDGWYEASLPADSFFDVFFEVDLDPDLLPDSFLGGPTIEDLGYAELLQTIPEPGMLGIFVLLAPLLAWSRQRIQ